MNVPQESNAASLLQGLASHAGGHLLAVEAGLRQLDSLLHEAVARLNDNFLALHRALSLQAQEGSDHAACAADIQRYLDGAITALQFQDMASQLIGGIDARVAGVHALLTQAAQQDARGDTQSALAGHIARDSTALAQRLQQPVHQHHMESGAIELF